MLEAFRSSQCDPTGAGNTFAGALFRGGERSEKAAHRAIVYGGVLASFVVEDFSVGRLRPLTMDELVALTQW